MSSTSSYESDNALTPETEANNVVQNLLPMKSRKYLRAYDNFILWKNRKAAKTFSENVFLAYFQVPYLHNTVSYLFSHRKGMKSRVYDSRANNFSLGRCTLNPSLPSGFYVRIPRYARDSILESFALLVIQSSALAVKILFCSLVIQSTIFYVFSSKILFSLRQ